MTDISQELYETKMILNSLVSILSYLDDVPEGCTDMVRLAETKVEKVEHAYYFPEEKE